MAFADVLVICFASCVAQCVMQCISWFSSSMVCLNKKDQTCPSIFQGIFGCINCIICVYAVYRMMQAMKNNV